MPMDKCTMEQVNEHVWIMRDEHNDTCYLVVGEDKAMLVDTMCGYVNVREAAESVTDKPLMVVNTHGHGDHVFGNLWFTEAWMHPDDLPMVNEALEDPQVQKAMREAGAGNFYFHPARQGDLFDLGGLTAEIIELPGHTPGGICVLLREDRILFTGDSINRHLWMQLDGCTSLKEYGEKLDAVAWVKEKADRILHGHASGPEPISLMDDMRRGIAEIVAGETADDSDYTWFGGVCRQHPYAENSVIVYDTKLQK
ncbi:MAG: MBL fold metallo-hydrolase [Clostridia bacterium]|nr:MBL fold metallo-hydrolase [Clostridia bacterium]